MIEANLRVVALQQAAIEAESFRKESGTSRYNNNRYTYHKLRTYAMGEQSVQKYKDELAIKYAREALEKSALYVPYAGWTAGLSSWRLKNYE